MWSIRLAQRAAVAAPPPPTTTTARKRVGGSVGLHHRRGAVASIAAVVQGDRRQPAAQRRAMSSSSSSSSSSPDAAGRVDSSSPSSSAAGSPKARHHHHPKNNEQRGEDDALSRAYRGSNFPDFIEHWNRGVFEKVGYALGAATSVLAVAPPLLLGGLEATTAASFAPALLAGGMTAAYWKVGLDDVSQTGHSIRRNYPVIGNMRYILETIRPEIRQYMVESDSDGRPLDRLSRSLAYQRSKAVDDTLPFGTRRDVYGTRYEWACHSMFPRPPPAEDVCDDGDDANDVGNWRGSFRRRTVIGTPEFGTTKPYSASLLNVSAMSYGAIGDNAILALSSGARMGRFYHVSAFAERGIPSSLRPPCLLFSCAFSRPYPIFLLRLTSRLRLYIA